MCFVVIFVVFQMAHPVVTVHRAAKVHQVRSQMSAILATAQTVHQQPIKLPVRNDSFLRNSFTFFFQNKSFQKRTNFKYSGLNDEKKNSVLFSDDESKNQKETSSTSSLVNKNCFERILFFLQTKGEFCLFLSLFRTIQRNQITMMTMKRKLKMRCVQFYR